MDFNFYPIFAIILLIFLIISKKDFFSMKRAEKRAQQEGKVLRDGATPLISIDVISIEPKKDITHHASNMIVPVATMVIMMIVSMLITGNGKLTEGSGSTSVLWAVMSAILVGGIKYRISGIMKFNELINLTRLFTNKIIADDSTVNSSGGKGHNLVLMKQDGLNVPSGVIVPTEVCNLYRKGDPM